ncbi:MAG: WD40 repeat domain-containing protein, partial [Cyanobacteria bacterium J06558_2]
DGNNHKKWQINDVITSLSISNKNNIAIGTEKGNISIWHPFQGHQKDIINNSTDSELGIFSIAIDPKGTHIIAGHGNGSISIWQNQDQNNCYKSEFSNEHNHNGQVNQIAFDPIDEKFITASEDRTIKIWNLNGKLIQEIDAHSDGVRTAIFNRKDQSIISGGVDDLIRIWHKNLYSPVIFKAENEKRYMELPASKISFNSKFKTLVLAPESFNPENIEIWLLDKSETPYRVIENDDNRETISSIQVDSRGETIATGYMDGQINLWDIKNSQNLLSWNANSSKITSIDFSKDSKKLLVGSIEGDVTVWDISTRQPSLHKPLEKYTDDVINIVRFSSDNKLIASAGNDTTAKVWSLNGNSSFPLNEGHTNTILDIAISKDNKYFATAGRDKTIILWDNKGNPITTYIGHKDWVTSVAFDLKNQRLFSGSKDGTVKMWSLESGLEISTFSHHLDLTNSLGQDNISINHLEYDSDNEILVSIDSNGNLLEWDLNIDRLTHRACNWMEGYIKSNIYATHQFKDCHSYFNTPLK